MPKSLTRTVLGRVSKEFLGPLLMTHGFTRKAPHFFRPSADLFHCVHLQASQWGGASSGQFTINLGATSASLYGHWTSRPLPSNPATAIWPIQQRIGLLSPSRRDLWWTVDANTETVSLGQQVVQFVSEFGLPFFDAFPDSEAILHAIRANRSVPGITDPQRPLLEAMLLVDRGEKDGAKDCILRALSKTKITGFKETILLIASRLGLKIDSVAV